ncbi:hypothetical protein TRVA0_001S04566 [Trichomonascus vanleenenianus]|uniref:uncharacterized protein n=1 Tax=Trichomonascus vanleenenianus TaxID=2268995 RepID=UPI003EC9906D
MPRKGGTLRYSSPPGTHTDSIRALSYGFTNDDSGNFDPTKPRQSGNAAQPRRPVSYANTSSHYTYAEPRQVVPRQAAVIEEGTSSVSSVDDDHEENFQPGSPIYQANEFRNRESFTPGISRAGEIAGRGEDGNKQLMEETRKEGRPVPQLPEQPQPGPVDVRFSRYIPTFEPLPVTPRKSGLPVHPDPEYTNKYAIVWCAQKFQYLRHICVDFWLDIVAATWIIMENGLYKDCESTDYSVSPQPPILYLNDPMIQLAFGKIHTRRRNAANLLLGAIDCVWKYNDIDGTDERSFDIIIQVFYKNYGVKTAERIIVLPEIRTAIWQIVSWTNINPVIETAWKVIGGTPHWGVAHLDPFIRKELLSLPAGYALAYEKCYFTLKEIASSPCAKAIHDPEGLKDFLFTYHTILRNPIPYHVAAKELFGVEPLRLPKIPPAISTICKTYHSVMKAKELPIATSATLSSDPESGVTAPENCNRLSEIFDDEVNITLYNEMSKFIDIYGVRSTENNVFRDWFRSFDASAMDRAIADLLKTQPA